MLRGLEASAELGYDRASAPGGQLARLPEVDPSADDPERLRKTITGFHRVAADTPLVARVMVDELNQDTERLDYLYERYIGPVLQSEAAPRHPDGCQSSQRARRAPPRSAATT